MLKAILTILIGPLMILMAVGCGSEQEKDYLQRMADEHQDDSPIKNASSELKTETQVSGQQVTYATVNGKEINGYLGKPESAGDNNPGMIVIHEWWGLNDNIRMMTDKLAGEGYTALAVDLYNGKVADLPDKAGTYARSVDQAEAIDNLKQAYSYLVDQQKVGKVGTIGWCFGGGWSLQTALALPDKIDATVIYYGHLTTDTSELKTLKMPVIGFFGAEDSGIPPKQAKAFESALNDVGVKNDIYIYDGAGHAFANPSGTRYQKEAAEDAWKKTVDFLAKNLK